MKFITLREWLPSDADLCLFPRLQKHLDVVVVGEYNSTVPDPGERTDWDGRQFRPAPFPHKHIYVWVLLKNGYAVGWNENPSRGWSFPVRKGE